MRNVRIIDGFIGEDTCAALIAHHKATGRRDIRNHNNVNANTFPGNSLLVAKVRELLPETAGAFDVAFLTAQFPGGNFYHVTHADNAKLACARHGTDQAVLMRDCFCDDVKVLPNHTPHRNWTTLLYLSSAVGGLLVLERPRQEIAPQPGRLVIFPADHHHFHRTTAVVEGERYSWNGWFK
jgi:hypothetical protein